MSGTSGRLLSLLSLLQMPRTWPGDELAGRLRVSRRTVRRDVERLRELGYPVRTTMGAGGGYRLVAGTAMPPLLLDDEEMVAIAAGLRTAAASAIEGMEDAAVRALAKLEQVLPSRLRHRIAALSSATVPPIPVPDGRAVDPAVLASVAAASASGQRLRFGYVSADGVPSRRLVEPCRLVTAGRRWYLVGFDNDQDDWRTFRVDRITEPFLTGQRFAARLPEDTDPAAFARAALYSTIPVFRAEVTVRLADALVRELLPGWEPADGRLVSPPDTVPCLASRLLGLGCEFEVHAPPELIDYLREAAARASRGGGLGRVTDSPGPGAGPGLGLGLGFGLRLGFGGDPLAFPAGAAAVRDHPGDDAGAGNVGHHLGDGQRSAGRGGLDDDDPGRRLGQVRDAPDHGVQPEGVTEAGVLPERFELAALRGVRPDELDGEPVDQRAARPERAEAQESEHRGGHRALDQHQPGIAAQQPEDGAKHDAGQDQHPDGVHAPVTDQPGGDTQGREGAAQDEGGHRALPRRAQQRVGHEGPGDVEDRDHRQVQEAVAVVLIPVCHASTLRTSRRAS